MVRRNSKVLVLFQVFVFLMLLIYSRLPLKASEYPKMSYFVALDYSESIPVIVVYLPESFKNADHYAQFFSKHGYEEHKGYPVTIITGAPAGQFEAMVAGVSYGPYKLERMVNNRAINTARYAFNKAYPNYELAAKYRN